MTVVTLHAEGRVSLRRLCRLCDARPIWVAELVELGVLQARGERPLNWHFDDQDLARSLRARRLARDLGLNPAGIALAIELADELRRTRRQLSMLRDH